MTKKKFKKETKDFKELYNCDNCAYGQHFFWNDRCRHKPLTKLKGFHKMNSDDEKNNMDTSAPCEYFKLSCYIPSLYIVKNKPNHIKIASVDEKID